MSRGLDSESARQRLYEAMDDGALSLREKQDRALAIGRDHLGVENGHVERTDGDAGIHEVVASVGDVGLPAGTTLDRATTYCRRTVERDSPLALSTASEEGWADDPAYLEHGFECYLGATIRVDGGTYGTVCFISRDARPGAFSATERAFVELVARSLGREIENERHRRRAERREDALERTERKYESLVATAPDAIFLVDVATREIADANRAAAELVGYGEDELVGRQFSEVHPPGDEEKYLEAFERFVRTEGTQDRFDDGSPIRVRRRDGTDVPVEISASVVELDGREYVQGIVRDITERRERERELRVKDRAIDEASVGITIADAAEGDLPLAYVNREFERLTGYAGADALGANCRFLQGPRTDPETVDEIRAAIGDREPITAELLNYRADDTPFWNELTITPVEDASGETTHFIGIQRDVTDRKRREHLIAVLNRVLRHNLRNEMNVVTGQAERLAAATDGEAAEIARKIADAGWDLVDLSRKARGLEATARDAGETEPRDVARAASDVAGDLRADYPDADVRVDAPGTARALANGHLRTALRELGENAIEHADGTPTVAFRISTDHGDCVVVEVADDGPGIPEAELRVLENGGETPLEHGSGLGLWLVNWIATDMGGRVTIDTDEGTTVRLHLRTPGDGGRDRCRRSAIGMSRD